MCFTLHQQQHELNAFGFVKFASTVLLLPTYVKGTRYLKGGSAARLHGAVEKAAPHRGALRAREVQPVEQTNRTRVVGARTEQLHAKFTVVHMVLHTTNIYKDFQGKTKSLLHTCWTDNV